MKTAIEWFFEQLEKDNHLTENEFLRIIQQAKEMEKEQELKIKIQCLKESLQFIDANYMVELLNVRIYNMEKELLTFKSE
jgi:predicted HTH domain antitoxin